MRDILIEGQQPHHNESDSGIRGQIYSLPRQSIFPQTRIAIFLAADFIYIRKIDIICMLSANAPLETYLFRFCKYLIYIEFLGKCPPFSFDH